MLLLHLPFWVAILVFPKVSFCIDKQNVMRERKEGLDDICLRNKRPEDKTIHCLDSPEKILFDLFSHLH
jgi:hypothetical protein